MMHKTLTFALAVLLTLGMPVAMAKQAGDTIPGQWIVILEDAPLATYSGEPVQQLQSDGRSAGKTLAPTSPEVTGEDKLNVHSTAARAYREHLDRRREAVMQQARDMLGRDVRAERVYSNAINGFSTHMSESEARALAGQPGVRAVVPDEIREMQLDAGPDWIGASSAWFDTDHGNRGEGVVIGIIDSGIAWGNPYFDDNTGSYTFSNPYGNQLGECSKPGVECNNKLVGVYDFTVEGTDGEDTTGHGSNVASIAAGNGLQLSMSLAGLNPIIFDTSGVAPRANIISYKVCYNDHPSNDDLDGNCELSAILDAIDQAVTDGVDAVNYSIGKPPGNPWSTNPLTGAAEAVAFLSARSAGVLPITSAGNEGPGPGTIGSPANGPWMVAAANSTHNRRLTNRVTNISGGDFSLDTLIGAGVTAGTGTLPIVHAADYGYPLCGEGGQDAAELGPSCADNTGATSPFDPGTFTGKIVVCDRGIYGRVEKGKNVMQAGAVGMILANAQAQGESIVADEHCLPATHIGANDGDALRDWLSSGGGHQGRLTGLTRQESSNFGDWMSASSSRGPADFVGNVLKPNLSAPGTEILGAHMDNESGDPSFGLFTGTSMASPHVAGAAALIRGAHPNWTPAMIHSALETTAALDGMLDENGEPATIVDSGAGRARVDRAINAGLYLNVTPSQFQGANPASGGEPGALNLPSMFDSECVATCSFTRTVTALESGSWQAGGTGDPDITVSPSSFSLQAGQSQTLQVNVDVKSSDLIGTWVAGGVELVPGDTSLATQKLPVGVFAAGGDLPAWIEENVDANRGKLTFDLPSVVDLPSATLATSPLIKPTESAHVLPQDLTQEDPFDSSNGTQVLWFEASEASMLLYAETVASSAEDIDLYVGYDSTGLGNIVASDVRCASISSNELESCTIRNPQPGDWWVLIQNWQGSIATSDEVTLLTGFLESADDPTLAVAGPGIHELGPLSLDLIWDQAAMKRNEDWIGAVSIGTDPDHPGNAGVVPVRLTRTAAMGDPMTALAPGVTEPVVIAGSDTRNRVFVDVPPTATALDVTLTGDDFSASLRRLDFEALDGVEPDTPPAPVDALASGSASGGSLELSVSGDDLQPGRYYVRIVNESAGENAVEVTPLLTETGRIEAQYGLTGPLNRTTNQGYSWQKAGWGFIIWYTYDEDGMSTFYLASAPVDDSSSVWTADLYRATSDQVEQVSTQVGTVTLTNTAPDRTVFTWRFNGAVGSEIMRPVTAPTCPDDGGGPVSWTGHWYLDGVAQGGTTMIVSQAAQAHVRYFFDRAGFPRWVITDGGLGPLDTDLGVLESRANCPYCAPVTPDVETVGTYQREFFSETEVHEVAEFTLRPPLDETVSLDTMQVKLSERLECQ